jgi:hypothetical protein
MLARTCGWEKGRRIPKGTFAGSGGLPASITAFSNNLKAVPCRIAKPFSL